MAELPISNLNDFLLPTFKDRRGTASQLKTFRADKAPARSSCMSHVDAILLNILSLDQPTTDGQGDDKGIHCQKHLYRWMSGTSGRLSLDQSMGVRRGLFKSSVAQQAVDKALQGTGRTEVAALLLLLHFFGTSTTTAEYE